MRQTNIIGFAFDEVGKYVLTLKADRPFWKDGALDGITSTVPKGSSASATMSDAGLSVGLNVQWDQFLRLSFVDCEFCCFVSVTSLNRLRKLPARPGITSVLASVTDLQSYRILPLLSWLVPMARFHSFQGTFDRLGFVQCQHEERIEPTPLSAARKTAKSR